MCQTLRKFASHSEKAWAFSNKIAEFPNILEKLSNISSGFALLAGNSCRNALEFEVFEKILVVFEVFVKENAGFIGDSKAFAGKIAGFCREISNFMRFYNKSLGVLFGEQ